MSQPAALYSKMVKFAQVTGAALEVGQKMAEKSAAEKQAVAAKLPTTVDALIAAGLLEKDARDEALTVLADPSRVMDVLQNIAAKTAEDKKLAHEKAALDRLGVAGTDPRTPRPSTEDPYVGRRRGSEKAASDIAFENALFGRRR